ncbi:MAG TPA: hypothetical protein VK922_04665 [Gemmatimonadaceae bacterium]|nr:hypothetical protein [Gemmatimonadaceae bacterium]
MKRYVRVGVGLAAFVGLVSCVANPAPVPLAGSQSEVAVLVGEWRGDYETTIGPPRFGSILFRLSPRGDVAHGDVLMVAHPDRVMPPELREAGDPWIERERIPQSQLLAITFVRASSGVVSGALNEYKDPVCGCTLRTTFLGRVAGDRIDGSFTSVHVQTGQVTGGEWRATRRQALVAERGITAER